MIIGTVILVSVAKAEHEVKLSYKSNKPERETENFTHQGCHGTNRACTQTAYAAQASREGFSLLGRNILESLTFKSQLWSISFLRNALFLKKLSPF